MTRRRTPRRSRSRARPVATVEWIGGVLSPPLFFEEDKSGTPYEEPAPARMVVWIEEPSGLIVGQQAVDPEDAERELVDELLRILEQPEAGPPRRPDRIRVAEDGLASLVDAALGGSIPVHVGAVPELDPVLKDMVARIAESSAEEGYLGDGRIAHAVVEAFFSAAEMLHEVAPWKTCDEGVAVRMDIPALGVEGACVTVIGSCEMGPGLAIFPSLEAFEAFWFTPEVPVGAPEHRDLGSDWLEIRFVRGAEIPASIRGEVARYGWPVADANAYPLLRFILRKGVSRPLTERDFAIATACTSCFSAFHDAHDGFYLEVPFEPVCESFSYEDAPEVRFTLPYDAASLFEGFDSMDDTPGLIVPDCSQRAGMPATEATRCPDHNAPCPCGSGRKYKWCCRPAHDAARADWQRRKALHERNEALALELEEFAKEHFRESWTELEKDFEATPRFRQLSVPWSVYHDRLDGRTALDAFLEAPPRHLRAAERSWFAAQRAAWLSVWQATQVMPGRGLTLRDLLSEEKRFVSDVSLSNHLEVHEAILARVVEADGDGLICGLHPMRLPQEEAAEVVRRAREQLGCKRAVPVARLQDSDFGRYLTRRWQEAVVTREERGRS